jgi:predicted regulator of Ras-like GTPase activity (Roadblock/LC7/MglB family)
VESRLDRFVAGVPGVIEAFAVGAEGLLSASSANVDRARADTIAAIAANLHRLTAAFANLLLAGRVGVTMIETSGGFLLVLGLADDSSSSDGPIEPATSAESGSNWQRWQNR